MYSVTHHFPNRALQSPLPNILEVVDDVLENVAVGLQTQRAEHHHTGYRLWSERDDKETGRRRPCESVSQDRGVSSPI